MRVLLAVAAAVLGAAVVVWSAFTADLDAAHARIAAGSTVARTPCGPIEYVTTGAGVPLLLAHGAGGGFDQGLLLEARARHAGIRLIVPSRFGYLRTAVPDDASPEAQADAHACLLDALGIGRVAVLGASAGALSAMQLCIRHPQRCDALVLLVPAAYTPPEAGRPVRVARPLRFAFEHALASDFALWATTRVAPGLLARTMLGTPMTVYHDASDGQRAAVIESLDAVQPVSRRTAGIVLDARHSTAPPRYALERIAAPTLVITARDDLYGTYASARYTAAHIPGARLVAYASGGHASGGHDEDIWREVSAFIRAGT